jgi:hypothetical protein
VSSSFSLGNETSDEKCIYFCGNSLGVQPRSTQKYIFSSDVSLPNEKEECQILERLPGYTRDLGTHCHLPPEFSLGNETSDEKCIYFCGNSLGVQPRSTQKYIEQYNGCPDIQETLVRTVIYRQSLPLEILLGWNDKLIPESFHPRRISSGRLWR